jgi:hypothetical protein
VHGSHPPWKPSAVASRLGRQSARPYRAAGAWVLPRALHDRIAELKGHICRGQARATYLLLHAASNSFTALSVASSAMQRARRTILNKDFHLRRRSCCCAIGIGQGPFNQLRRGCHQCELRRRTDSARREAFHLEPRRTTGPWLTPHRRRGHRLPPPHQSHRSPWTAASCTFSSCASFAADRAARLRTLWSRCGNCEHTGRHGGALGTLPHCPRGVLTSRVAIGPTQLGGYRLPLPTHLYRNSPGSFSVIGLDRCPSFTGYLYQPRPPHIPTRPPHVMASWEPQLVGSPTDAPNPAIRTGRRVTSTRAPGRSYCLFTHSQPPGSSPCQARESEYARDS